MSPRKRRPSALFDDPIPPVEDVVVQSLRLADEILARISVLFSSFGCTMLQFNVLRILYVQDPNGEGRSSGSIGAQLVTRVPDVTRLLDRLVKAGLLERFRTEEDRRVVKIRLTGKGIDLVEKIHEPLMQHNRDLFAHMSKTQLEQLARGLKRAQKGLVEAGNQEKTK